MDPERTEDPGDHGDARDSTFSWVAAVGSQDWPLAPKLLERVAGGKGLASLAQALHWGKRGRCFQADEHDIPKEQKVVLHPTCGSMHPGVCITRDCAEYTEIATR